MPLLINAYANQPVDQLVLIGSVVAAGSPTTLTVSSIPTTYNNLLCTLSGRVSGGSFSRSAQTVRINGVATATYGDQQYGPTFQGVAGHYANAFAYAGEIPNTSGPANYAGQIQFDFANYKDTTWFKQWQNNTGYGTDSLDWYVINYASNNRATAAINQITISTLTGTYINGTTFRVYGY